MLQIIIDVDTNSWTSHCVCLLVSLISPGEYHGNNPEMSKLLHKAVRQKSESAYSVYQQHLANRPVNVSCIRL